VAGIRQACARLGVATKESDRSGRESAIVYAPNHHLFQARCVHSRRSGPHTAAWKWRSLTIGAGLQVAAAGFDHA